MKIFIDFDDVIFNAKRFKNDLIRVFLKNGVTRLEFDNSYYTFPKKAQKWGRYYDPRKQIDVLRRAREIDRKKLGQDISGLLRNGARYVFSDFYPFIGNFKKKDLYLITYGHEKFQMEKIRGSGISKFFQKIIISKKDKIKEILETIKNENFLPGEGVFFIDDRPEQIEEAEKRRKSITTFHMCRPEGRYSNLACKTEDYEVKNLKQALKIIQGHKVK